jgi:SpoIID/LytB domain protein
MKTFLLFIFIFFCTSHQIKSQLVFSEEPIVKVRIIYTIDSLAIVFNNDWNLKDSTTLKSLEVNKFDSILFIVKDDEILLINPVNNIQQQFKHLFLTSKKQNETIKIKNVPFGIGWWWQGSEDRNYEGQIEICVNQNKKFDVIVILPLEKYLCGVIPYEIGNDAPIEALKAQAIAARSETVSALLSAKYKGANYDLCADVECQVFAGNNKRTEITDKAVFETKGLCIFYDGKVIGAYYASNCGGLSENVENVWQGRSGAVEYWSSHFDSDEDLNFDAKNNPKEWIESNPDVFCNPFFHQELPEWSKKNFRWQVEMSSDELSKNLNEIKFIGSIKNIIPVERGNSGRIIKAKFIGTIDSLELFTELEIRKIRKPPFKSSCFIVEEIGGNEILKKFLFKGAGWGHGVGMCQSGAVARAVAGQNYETILQHYFPKTKIKNYNYK